MPTLIRVYDQLIASLAVVAGLVVWLIVAAIVSDVLARNIGIPGTEHTFVLVEYGLLVITLLGCPWLIRNKGHVYVEILYRALPERVQRVLAVCIYLLCGSACLLVSVYSLGEVISAYQRGVMETRSFDIPRWIPLSVFPVGFFLMFVEFLRCLIRRDALQFGPDINPVTEE